MISQRSLVHENALLIFSQNIKINRSSPGREKSGKFSFFPTMRPSLVSDTKEQNLF